MFVCYCQYQTSKQHINRQADVCRRGTDICSPHTHVCHQNTLGIIPYYFLTPPNSSTCLWQELVANKLLLKTISFLDHLNKKREALKAKSHTLRNGNFWSCLASRLSKLPQRVTERSSPFKSTRDIPRELPQPRVRIPPTYHTDYPGTQLLFKG